MTTIGPLVSRVVHRLQRTGLSTRLILLSTLLTLASVSLSFLTLGLEVRRQTRNRVAETVARQQTMIREMEQRKLEQLLRTSSMLTDSPTLRAALEIWRTEMNEDTATRPDLLATIAAETDKLAGTLGQDLLIITDERGRVLAAAARHDDGPAVGQELPSSLVLHSALRPGGPANRNLGVLLLGDRHYRVGTVPIQLQGFLIGALVLGDTMDTAFVNDLREVFSGEVVLGVGNRVVESTLPLLRGVSLPADLAAVFPENTTPPVVRIDGEDYVTAALRLGPAGTGNEARAYFLHSLTDAVAQSSRSLMRSALIIGALTVTFACWAAWRVSGSLLHPLQSFVDFMRSVAQTGDRSLRFSSGNAGREIATLADACNGLIGSLDEHERAMLQRAHDDLERMERLKESEKLAALGRMLSGAAHEINNPLTGVIGNIELLLAHETMEPPVRNRLEAVQQEGRRVVKLVRRLLNIARRETEDRSVVDVSNVVRQVAGLRQHDFDVAGVTLRLDLPPDVLPVLGNELELQQVFLNIVGNAFDAVRDSGPAPRVEVSASSGSDSVTIEICDSGPGILQPDRIFELFYTTKPVGQGTGLGLGICHAIIQRMSGAIDADNLPQGGARFTIRLPRAAHTDPVLPTPKDVPSEVRGPNRSIPASVLVVDDEASVLQLQVDILQMIGAVPTGVASGDAAIERLEHEKFDLIISDLRMPGRVSGKDLFGWIEHNLPDARQRFLFVTGDTIEEAAFLERAGVRCVLKPFTMDQYVNAIQEVFDGTSNTV